MSDDYAPFPEMELLEYAASTPAMGLRTAIHDAIAAHNAVRERMLIAELERDQLKRLATHAA